MTLSLSTHEMPQIKFSTYTAYQSKYSTLIVQTNKNALLKWYIEIQRLKHLLGGIFLALASKKRLLQSPK